MLIILHIDECITLYEKEHIHMSMIAMAPAASARHEDQSTKYYNQRQTVTWVICFTKYLLQIRFHEDTQRNFQAHAMAMSRTLVTGPVLEIHKGISSLVH